MRTGLILELDIDQLRDGMASLLPERPDGVIVEGESGMRIAEYPALLDAPLPVLLKLPEGSRPESILEGIEHWPDMLSLLIPGRPEALEGWVAAATRIPAPEPEQQPEGDAGKEDAPQAAAQMEEEHEEDENRSFRVWPRIIPWIKARQKEKIYRMSSERNLSGFTFYIPSTVAMEGYEILFADIEDEGLSHEERLKKYDLRRWLGRYVSVLQPLTVEIVVLLESRTAIERGRKGYDIEMSAYCREKAGVRAIVLGGVGTVRHVLNLERHGKAAGAVLDKEIYDGSFSLHDVRAFVDAEMEKLKDRGSSLAAGVLSGGRLAGDSTGGYYWQRPAEKDDDRPAGEE